jgi:hypothetical protein
MIPAEVLMGWNVADRGQPREFFNSIDPKRTLGGSRLGASDRDCQHSVSMDLVEMLSAASLVPVVSKTLQTPR